MSTSGRKEERQRRLSFEMDEEWTEIVNAGPLLSSSSSVYLGQFPSETHLRFNHCRQAEPVEVLTALTRNEPPLALLRSFEFITSDLQLARTKFRTSNHVPAAHTYLDRVKTHLPADVDARALRQKSLFVRPMGWYVIPAFALKDKTSWLRFMSNDPQVAIPGVTVLPKRYYTHLRD